MPDANRIAQDVPVGASAVVSALDWERIAAPGAGEGPTALALDRGEQRIAVGDARGVLVGEVGGALERVLRRGPVHDLAFLRDGSLLAATGAGLYRVGVDARVAQVRVGAGEAANAVHRVGVSPGLIAVASRNGVHVSRDGRAWRRLVRLPLGEATLVALRARGDAVEVWSWVNGGLWNAEVGPLAPLAAAGPAERVRVPFVPRDGGAVDLAFDLPHAEVLVVFPSALVAREHPHGDWRVLRPALPPGASAVRIAFALGRYWLATDTGLVVAESLGGPWHRAAGPAGRLPVRALASATASLHVATRAALLRGVPAPPVLSRAGPARAALPADPEITQVHRVALTYLSLQPARMELMRRGVERRGWLPILSFRMGHDRANLRRRDFDQSFVSGATHDLFDEQLDRDRELAMDLTLSWDFGDVVFHPEEIDVLRESRAVIELRDDVLDEITQLYFERRRVLGQLVELDGASMEARALRQRAAELAAGIDAWTGGWFSRHVAAP